MILTALHRVYQRPRYVIVTLVVALVTISMLLLLPNQALLVSIITSPTIDWGNKLAFFFSLHGVLLTNFTWFAATYTVLLAILLGVNVSLLWFYIVRSRRLARVDSRLTLTGIGGFVSGILGIGCAACGTVILAGAFKLLGIAWLLTYLPWQGAEFGVLGVLLLGLTTYTLCKRINDPVTCPV